MQLQKCQLVSDICDINEWLSKNFLLAFLSAPDDVDLPEHLSTAQPSFPPNFNSIMVQRLDFATSNSFNFRSYSVPWVCFKWALSETGGSLQSHVPVGGRPKFILSDKKERKANIRGCWANSFWILITVEVSYFNRRLKIKQSTGCWNWNGTGWKIFASSNLYDRKTLCHHLFNFGTAPFKAGMWCSHMHGLMPWTLTTATHYVHVCP